MSSITDKIFFGTDYPFSNVIESINSLKDINRLVEGTNLPKVTSKSIDNILYSNPFEHWWANNPLD